MATYNPSRNPGYVPPVVAPPVPRYVPPVLPPGATFGRRQTGGGGRPGVRPGSGVGLGANFNPFNTSPFANPVVDLSAPPKFNLLSNVKSQSIADANAAALGRATTAGTEIGGELKRYLAESNRLNAQAGAQLAKDAATYNVDGLRGELAAQDARYEAAARAQASRAVDFASRASDRSEMNRGALGMSSQRSSERSRAYLDAVLPVEQQLAERQARTAMALKQMELANAGRIRSDIADYQSRLFNPVAQRLSVASGVDALLNPVVARDQANTFYGLNTEYQPTVPAPTYFGPTGGVDVPGVVGAAGVAGGATAFGGRGVGAPAMAPAAAPVRMIAPPTTAKPVTYRPPATTAPGSGSGRTFYFNNGRPAPSPTTANVNLQRALAGEVVDDGPSGYYTNGAPMPGRYAAAAQMAALVPYSSAYARPYSPPAPTVPQYGRPERFVPPSFNGQPNANGNPAQAVNQAIIEAYRAQTGYYPQTDPNRSDYLLQQIRADILARQPQATFDPNLQRIRNRVQANIASNDARREELDPFKEAFAMYDAQVDPYANQTLYQYDQKMPAPEEDTYRARSGGYQPQGAYYPER